MLQTYTLDELAAILKICNSTARRLVLGHQIKRFRVGNEYRVTEDAIQEYIKKTGVQMTWYKWAILITVTYAVMTGIMMYATEKETWEAGQSCYIPEGR